MRIAPRLPREFNRRLAWAHLSTVLASNMHHHTTRLLACALACALAAATHAAPPPYDLIYFDLPESLEPTPIPDPIPDPDNLTYFRPYTDFDY